MLTLFFIGILCWVVITDIYTQRIPDSAILAAIGFRFFVFLFLEGLSWKGLGWLIVNGLAVSLPLLFIVSLTEKFFHRCFMGGGDIKLLFVTGMYLGWEKNLWTLFIACLIGCVVGLIISRQKKEAMVYFPFGPFIAIGAIVSMHFF